MRNTKTCERCGKPKQPPRDRMTSLCVECEAETACRHYLSRPFGLIPDDWCCDAGVCLMELTAPRRGCMTRIPCRWIHGNKPVACDKFAQMDIADCLSIDKAVEDSEARMQLALVVIRRVKEDHKGES